VLAIELVGRRGRSFYETMYLFPFSSPEYQRGLNRSQLWQKGNLLRSDDTEDKGWGRKKHHICFGYFQISFL